MICAKMIKLVTAINSNQLLVPCYEICTRADSHSVYIHRHYLAKVLSGFHLQGGSFPPNFTTSRHKDFGTYIDNKKLMPTINYLLCLQH